MYPTAGGVTPGPAVFLMRPAARATALPTGRPVVNNGDWADPAGTVTRLAVCESIGSPVPPPGF